MHVDIPPAYLEKIKEVYPNLEVTKLEFNQDGLVNDVVIINNALVCRFPKSDWAKTQLRHEARVLDLVRPYIGVAIPQYEHLQDDFASYPFIPGKPVTRRLLLALSPAERQRVVEQLGEFIRRLHTIPLAETASVSPSDTNRSRGWWLGFYTEVREVLYPYLVRHQRDEIDAHFSPVVEGRLELSYAPALINGDLGPYHLLFDDRTRRLSGVIDFGTAGLGDPAVDLAVLLYSYGETLVKEIRQVYPDMNAYLDRAQFWAGTLELQWALGGVKNKDKLFLLAHIGGARDLAPIG